MVGVYDNQEFAQLDIIECCSAGEKTSTIHVNDGVIRLNRNGSERNQRGRGRVTLQPAAGEKSLYQLKNKVDNNNRGQRGQSRGNGRNEREREKRKKTENK